MTIDDAFDHVAHGLDRLSVARDVADALADEVRRLQEHKHFQVMHASTCVHCGARANVGGQCDNCREIERLREENERLRCRSVCPHWGQHTSDGRDMVCWYEAAGRRAQRNGFTPATVRKFISDSTHSFHDLEIWLDEQEALL